MNIHNLDGCAPIPLAFYLKALGILRLVSEQEDAEGRGWWEGDRFKLATRLDKAQLEEFFLTRYEPTGLVAPWNKGSGFFYSHDPGLTPLEKSSAKRFEKVRMGIKAAQTQLDGLVQADKIVRTVKGEATGRSLTGAQKKSLKESPDYKKRLAEAERIFKKLKEDVLPRIRLSWRGSHLEWLEAAMVLGDDGTPLFPALLGTGGNDGRLDFTNNFMRRLNEIFDLSEPDGSPRTSTPELLSGSLWGGAVTGLQSGIAVGQYLPGMAGGANSSNGPEGESLANPVDFILMLEGAILFTANATRRMGTLEQSRAAAPFAVRAQSAGYASAANSDESARGEQWMPLWAQPLTLPELRHLLSEGRAQIGRQAAREPLDLARAVARLGSVRGIVSFQRYGYIERNGQSNLAVPLGRFHVPNHVPPRLACLDDLDAWLPRLRRQARDTRSKKAPERLKQAERRLGDLLFALVQHSDEPARWQSVLLALAEVEGVLRTGIGLRAGPVPLLRPDWVSAANDGSAEFRLAVAFALQEGGYSSDKLWWLNPVRRHWLPLDPHNPRRFAVSKSGGQIRIQRGPEVVIEGRSGIDDCIALIRRRIIEASQHGERRLPLVAERKAAAHPSDLADLLTGTLDLERTITLARAMMALDRTAWAQKTCLLSAPAVKQIPDDGWLAIRLSMLPWELPEGRGNKLDPAVFRRLESGDATSALELALRRLRAAGIVSTVRATAVPPGIARLWAAALAFPIGMKTAESFLRRLDPNSI